MSDGLTKGQIGVLRRMPSVFHEDVADLTTAYEMSKHGLCGTRNTARNSPDYKISTFTWHRYAAADCLLATIDAARQDLEREVNEGVAKLADRYDDVIVTGGKEIQISHMRGDIDHGHTADLGKGTNFLAALKASTSSYPEEGK